MLPSSTTTTTLSISPAFTNMQDFKLYISLLPVLLALDLVWIGVVMNKFYDSQLGALARRVDGVLAPHWPSALLVYLMMPLGIVFFALPRAGNDHLQAALWGALLGFLLYGVYDLTNLATLANWPLRFVIVDMTWGTVLCGIVALVGSYIAPMLK